MSDDLHRDLIIHRQLRAIRTGSLIIVATIHLGLALPALLAGLDHHRHPWLSVSVFAVLTLILAVSIHVDIAGRPWPRGWVPTAMACILVASATANSQLPPEDFFGGTTHWSFQVSGWFAVVLLIHRGPLATSVFLACHLAVAVIQLLAVEVPTRPAGASMAIAVVSVTCFQLTLAAGGKLLIDRSAAIGEARTVQERVSTRIAVATQIHADQRRRYTELDATVLPLLTGLANGSLDPGDEEVRRACTLEATRLRRLFAESDYSFDPLVHELRACIDVAERNGIAVQLAVRGAPADLPVEQRRALIDPVIAALAAARRTARLTVVRGASMVRVGVVIDAQEARLPETASCGVRVRTVRGEDRLLVEAACPDHSSSSDIRPS